jgi:hypothetical protein
MFVRIHKERALKPQKLPPWIVAVIPEPVIRREHSGSALKRSILRLRRCIFLKHQITNTKRITSKRVFPPTVNQMDALLLSSLEIATALHFMGHYGQKHVDDQRDFHIRTWRNGNHEFLDTFHLAINPKTCDSYSCWLAIVMTLPEHCFPYATISYYSLPDDLIHTHTRTHTRIHLSKIANLGTNSEKFIMSKIKAKLSEARDFLSAFQEDEAQEVGVRNGSGTTVHPKWNRNLTEI